MRACVSFLLRTRLYSYSSGERQFPSSSLPIKSVRPSVTKLATPSQKKVGHKTRNPVPRKGSVTKLATASREKGRSQNSQLSVLVNVSSLAPSPFKSVSPSVRPSQNSPPHPKKIPVTKLETPSREKARSQNSRPHPEKRLGHKTRDPIPKKGSVTKLETPSREKARSQNSGPHPEKSLGHKT